MKHVDIGRDDWINFPNTKRKKIPTKDIYISLAGYVLTDGSSTMLPTDQTRQLVVNEPNVINGT